MMMMVTMMKALATMRTVTVIKANFLDDEGGDEDDDKGIGKRGE